MTPSEFIERVLGAVDEAALLLAGLPCEQQSAWLDGFDLRVGRQWRQTFAPFMSASDIDGMVADLLRRVCKRRDEIEAAGVGTA